LCCCCGRRRRRRRRQLRAHFYETFACVLTVRAQPTSINNKRKQIWSVREYISRGRGGEIQATEKKKPPRERAHRKREKLSARALLQIPMPPRGKNVRERRARATDVLIGEGE
jgi:hypothetical protein